jgi:curli biogenesis system outer membrane secretion channel CsgG
MVLAIQGAPRNESPSRSLVGLAVTSFAALALSGCVATTPTVGGGSATPVTGAAGGATATGANANLEKCTETLGTLRIEENTAAPWYAYYQQNYRVGSTVPVLRTLIQQSNCFVIVERGRSMRSIEDERNQGRGAEARAGSNVQQGQQVVADYLLSPEIMMNAKGTQGVGAAIGGLLSRSNPLVAGLAGGMSLNEAGVVLLLTDIRSTVQLSAAEGYSKNWNFGVGGAMFGALGAGGAGGFMNTPEGKLIASAFVDAYNKMVVSLREYKAQQVKGGLGTGGRLGVQGGQTKASEELKTQSPAPQAQPTTTTRPPQKAPQQPPPKKN